MDKETLVRNLQERIGDSDFGVLSQRTVDSIIEPLLPMFQDDSSINDDSYVLPVNILKSYIGQYRHDVSEGIRKATASVKSQEPKEETKKEEPLGSPEPSKTTEPQPNADKPDFDALIGEKIEGYLKGLTGEDGVLGKLSREFTSFKSAYEEKQKNERIGNIKDRLADYLLSLDSSIDDDDFVLEYTLERFNVDLNSDFESQKTKFKDAYEKNYKRINKGSTFTPMAGGAGGDSDSTQAFEAFLADKAEKAAAQAKDAEALKNLMI